MTVKLEVTKRDMSAAKVRAAGNVPAVVYGPKQEPVSISVPKVVFEKTLKEAGESTVIVLSGLGEEMEVLVHEVAFNAEKGGVEHVDFYAIEKGKELSVHVPLEFVGESPALKLGGSLTKVLHEVEVRCKPADLPQHIEVDVTSLTELGSTIHVKDIEAPKGVHIENNPDDVIVLVQEMKEEPVEEAPAVDMEAVAVEAKGKAEEGTSEAA